MDKYEYKVRADEIKSLIAEGRYDEAVKIADSIDWRRVKSVMMLCTISDLYKINRRYEDSRDILLLAYDRHAGGRLIVYSLCELSIKLGEFVQALEYYKEFVQLAPGDSGRYVLQYKLYEAQEVSLEERIAVLEELKRHELRERWQYELAYLYHRVGLATKCVEECDEIFLLYGEGRYVLKALELKKLHMELSEEQQEKYEQMKENGGFIISDYAADQQAIKEEADKETEEEEDDEFSLEQNILTEDTQEIPDKDLDDIQVKTVDISQYNTINLQKVLADGLKEVWEDDQAQNPSADETLDTQVYEPLAGLEARGEAAGQEEALQEETAASGEQEESGVSCVKQDTDEMQPVMPELLQEETPASQDAAQNAVPGGNKQEEVFFGNTEEVNIQDVVSELTQQNGSRPQTLFAPMHEEVKGSELFEKEERKETAEAPVSAAAVDKNAALSNTGVIRTFHKPSGYDNILSQEYDGQISLVVPESEKVEKQITGQLSIEDIMAEWERMKQENERKRMEEIRKRVHQQTDNLFADFDESTKSGLLEELETAMVAAALKEERVKADRERPKVVKVADIEKTPEETAVKEEKAPEETQNQEIEEEPLPEVLPEEEPAAAEPQEESRADEEESETAQEEDTQQEDVQTEDNLLGDIPLEELIGEATRPEDALIQAAQEREVLSPDLDAAEAEEKKQTASNTEKPEPAGEEAKAEPETESKYKAREMTNGEREQFAPFIHHKKTRRQIVEAIDNISMASYTGNVVVTGEEGTGTIALAKLLVKEVQLSDSNFSGKVAKISGSTMNKKDVDATLSKLSGGALIIEGATAMKKETVQGLLKTLNQEGKGLIVLMEDTRSKTDDFLAKYPEMKNVFNLRVDVEALDDQTLVKYAKKYAQEQEYSIDEFGVLALHTRIADMQTSDHEVTLAEIEEMVDEAIYYADRKTPKHFFDILFGKRYDEEDMIILREKDFMHY